MFAPLPSPTPALVAVPFQDREHAGRLLAAKLIRYQASVPLILAVPDGGYAVGRPIAQALFAQLYCLGEWEGGETGLLSGDARRFRDRCGSGRRRRAGSRGHGRIHLAERARMRMDGLPSPRDRVVIVVEDGLSPDRELQAVVDALRDGCAARIVVVAPVLPLLVAEALSGTADEIIALTLPRVFGAADRWYDDDTDSISGTSMPIR